MGFAESIKKVIGIEELDDDEMITEEEVNAAKEKIAKEPRRSYVSDTVTCLLYTSRIACMRCRFQASCHLF